MRAWMLVGIFIVTAVLYTAVSTVSGLVAPLVVAVVIGMLLEPTTTRLARRMPRQLATGVVLVGLLVVAGFATMIAVEGIVEQSSQIGAQISAGWAQLQQWLGEIGLEDDAVGVPEQLGDLASGMLGGLAGYAGVVFSSATSLVAGTLIGIFLLYFVLADWQRLSGWVATHLGVAPDVGRGLVDDAVFLTREYFFALTVSSILTAVVIGIAAAALGVPLAVTIAIVTFITSYVPYIGAIFSGVFAALIALGAGGTGDAVVLVAVILVAQNIIQTIVQTTMTESRLDLHPIVAFGSTIVGAVVAGVLGATLSAPVVALLIRGTQRVRAADAASRPPPREGAGV